MPTYYYDRTFHLTQSGGNAVLSETTSTTPFASASDVSSAFNGLVSSGGYVTSGYVTSAISASVASGGAVKNYVTSALNASVASGGVVNTYVTSAIAAAIPTSSGGAS